MTRIIKAIDNIFMYIFFIGLLFTPLIGMFLFVWVLTLNVFAATLLSIIAQAVYIWFFW
jgi:hypothetical protein